MYGFLLRSRRNDAAFVKLISHGYLGNWKQKPCAIWVGYFFPAALMDTHW